MRYNILDLGREDYGICLQLQEDMAAKRVQGEVLDTLILVEHPPVVTFGRRTENPDTLIAELSAKGINVYRVERGGKETYHDIGQLVVYPIIERQYERKMGYMESLEEIMIRTIKDFGIEGYRRQEKDPGEKHRLVGVWISDNKKIGYVGVSFRNLERRYITMHGFALNVNNDLSRFNIKICGLCGVEATSMTQELGRKISVEEVKPSIIKHFSDVFGYNTVPVKLS